MKKEDIQKRISELKAEISELEQQLVECPCRSCGEEVDIFGHIIDEKYFCSKCSGPVVYSWHASGGKDDMPKSMQKRVAKQLIGKIDRFKNE